MRGADCRAVMDDSIRQCRQDCLCRLHAVAYNIASRTSSPYFKKINRNKNIKKQQQKKKTQTLFSPCIFPSSTHWQVRRLIYIGQNCSTSHRHIHICERCQATTVIAIVVKTNRLLSVCCRRTRKANVKKNVFEKPILFVSRIRRCSSSAILFVNHLDVILQIGRSFSIPNRS